MASFWGFTMIGVLKYSLGFSAPLEKDPAQAEIYFRLNSIFAKNKYGYTTRFMSDFDLLLEGALNERFIDESTLYYDDEVVSTEIEDMEAGLNGEFAEDDIRNLLKDKSSHGESHKSLRFPDRVGNGYAKSDDLSCYKVHPSGSKPAF
jgi:hypothetical protein